MTILSGLPGGPPYSPNIVQFKGYQKSDQYRPLVEGERGVILWSGVQVEPDGLTISGCPLDPGDVRAAILLNDRIDWPWNDVLVAELGPDEAFLMSEGILRRSLFMLGGGDWFGSALRTNELSIDVAETNEPGRWSVVRHTGSENSFPSDSLENAGLIVRLNRCIPVPSRDVPLEDILNFKERRMPELRALQTHIDRIYQSIIAAPDRARAEDTELAALDRALKDHCGALRETSFKKVLGSLEANFDLGKLAAAGAGGVVAFNAGLPLMQALVVGASSLTISAGLSRRGAEKSAKPFEYVTRIHNELF